MPTVTLHILAKDFYESRYDDADNCAITRALKRAGLRAKDAGPGIYLVDSANIITEGLNIDENLRISLIHRVLSMYRFLGKAVLNLGYKEEPKDFTFELTYNE